MENTLTIRPTTELSTGIAPVLHSFITYLDVTEVTKASYMVCLRCFADWLQDNGIQQPQRADILDYVRYLGNPHPSRRNPAEIVTMSAGTQARYLRAVKLFFRWAEQQGLYRNVADHVKGAKVRADNTKRDAFQKDDARNLLQSIERTTPAGKRDYAMILLSMTAGLRIIEMQRAMIGDIETIAGEKVLFIQGKGHQEKDAYKKLTPEVYAAINDYLQTRKHRSSFAPLFAGTGNRNQELQLTEPSVSRIIKNRMKAAGYDTHRLSAHSLRHTSVTCLLESGATLQEAQAHARHADPATTGIYAHNLDQRRSHTEQRIYDFIFNVQGDPAEEAADCFRRMSATQQAKALELLKAITG